MNRLVMVSGTVLAFAFAVAMQEGCSSSDSGSGGTPASTGGSGNATSTGGSGNATSMAGTGTAGTSPGTAGTTTSGGTSAGGAPAGGAPAGGTGGAAAGSGGAPAGGTGGGGGAVPLCAGGETKAMACTAATPEGMACGKTCGLKNEGATKSETCTTGAYVEGLCTYPPAGDYHCFALPMPVAACGATAPKSGDACTAADCSPPCGPYADSMGMPKTGYCVCVAGKYACASDKEWPPQ